MNKGIHGSEDVMATLPHLTPCDRASFLRDKIDGMAHRRSSRGH